MQFTSIPAWFSIGQFIAESCIVWWKLHVTRVDDFPAFNWVAHALLLIATASSSTTTSAILLAKLTYGGEKPSSSSAFSFLWVRTRQPEIKVSKRRFRGEGGDCSGWIKSHYVRQNGTFKPHRALFPKIAKVCSLRGGWVGKKNPDLSLGGLLFLLPSHQVTVNKLLSIYSGISSWVPRSERLIDRGANKGCSPSLAVTIVKEGGEQ